MYHHSIVKLSKFVAALALIVGSYSISVACLDHTINQKYRKYEEGIS